MADLLGDGIFNSDGAQWQEQRRAALKIFTRRNFSSWMMDVFKENSRHVVALLAAQPAGRTLDLQSVYYKVTCASQHFAFPVPSSRRCVLFRLRDVSTTPH